MKYEKIPTRVIKAFDNYGENIGFELPTLAGLIKDAAESNGPANDEVQDFLAEAEGRLEIADDMLMSATGWTAQSLVDNSFEEFMTLAEFIEREVDEDQNCPFDETHSALRSFTREGDNWDAQRETANELFELMFGETAEDMLITISQAINEKLPKPEGKKADNSLGEPTL
jgi:hypothetical protein